jgi:hypothetical protein
MRRRKESRSSYYFFVHIYLRHTASIAKEAKHYLQVTDEHFVAAVENNAVFVIPTASSK